MKNIAIYPGTFDPITYGHIDVIKKALKLFNRIVVGVSDVSNTSYRPQRWKVCSLKGGQDGRRNNFF